MQSSAVFVYGTLKRGECRERSWPRSPISIQAAFARGVLFDLGFYPALWEGENIIAGEVWRFADVDMEETLAQLDIVEGYANRPDDLYRRQLIDCWTSEGERVAAHTYFYARPESLLAAKQIPPDADDCCRWSESKSLP